VLALALTPVTASANPEPGAYDARYIAMGQTGTSFIESGSAMVLNPANMEGIEHLSFGFNMTNLLVVSAWAPTMGPNTRGTAFGYGPLPAGYLAGRIADRVVLGGSLTIDTGFGGSFKDVVCLDGENFLPNNEANTDPATCLNPAPQELSVTFFQGEAALGVSIRAIDKLWFGITLRLPFSKQIADIYGNLLASQGAVMYGRSKTDLGGIGFPSPRIGITYKPNDKVSVGVMYRMWTKITLTGTAETSILPETFSARTTWNIPHALQFGVAYKPNPNLLFSWEIRMQFHGAEKHGNPNQTTEVRSDTIDLTTITPFGWKNVYSGRFGAEYRFPKTPLLALRGGFNISNSATVKQWATYFGPQPFKPLPSINLGLGFFFDNKRKERKDMFKLDFAAVFFYGPGSVGDEYIGQTLPVPGTDQTQTVCSFEQVQRTGCPGDYGNFTTYIALGFGIDY
jgi:long-subunit fatty acid transport protein